MDIELGVKAQVAARRSAHPWLEGDHLALGPGPQLFTDWQHVARWGPHTFRRGTVLHVALAPALCQALCV